MVKHCVFIACFLFGFQLITADTLPTFTASSVSADLSGGGCLNSFTVAGPSFDVSGFSGNVCPAPWIAYVGSPSDGGLPFDAEFTFEPGINPAFNGGRLTLNGVTYQVGLSSGFGNGFFGNVLPDGPSPFVPLDDHVTLAIPGTATGMLEAVCFPAGVPPSCGSQFNPLADLAFNLPGVITVQLRSSERAPHVNIDIIEGISFMSTPEPSSFALLILGMLAVGSSTEILRKVEDRRFLSTGQSERATGT